MISRKEFQNLKYRFEDSYIQDQQAVKEIYRRLDEQDYSSDIDEMKEEIANLTTEVTSQFEKLETIKQAISQLNTNMKMLHENVTCKFTESSRNEKCKSGNKKKN